MIKEDYLSMGGLKSTELLYNDIRIYRSSAVAK